MMQLILNNFLIDKRNSVHPIKYIKQEVILDGGVAGCYKNIMAMPVLNVAPPANF